MKKYIFYAISALFCLSIVLTLFYLRSENLKKKLEDTLISAIEEYTAGNATVKEVSINPLMFSLQISQLRVLDASGTVVVGLEKGRLYISPLELIKKRIFIRRAVIYGLYIGRGVEDFIATLKSRKHLSVKRKAKKRNWTFSIRNVSIRDASATVSLGNKEVRLEHVFIDSDLFRGWVKLKKGKYSYSDINGNLKASLTFKDKNIKIRNFYIDDQNKTRIEFEGSIDNGLNGRIKADINLMSISEIMNYKQKARGDINAEGIVKLKDLRFNNIGDFLKKFYASLKLKGNLYVQDMLHLLKVKEPISGRAEFHGTLKGFLFSPVLKLRVKEGAGSLYGINFDSIVCDVTFKDRRMLFANSNVSAYGGNAHVDVQFLLPVKWFQVKVVASALNAKDVLKLIKWNPGLPEGKVWGSLYFSGRKFAPSGYFLFRSNGQSEEIKNPLQEIKEIKGYFRKFGNSLYLERLSVKGDRTEGTGSGVINFKSKVIHMNVKLKTDSLEKIFLRDDTTGSANIKATVEGRLNKLIISADVDVRDGVFMGIALGNAKGRISYNIRSIRFLNWTGGFDEGSYDISGLIYTGSDRLFVIEKPYFNISVESRGLYLRRFKRFVDIPEELSGILKGLFTVKGYPDDLKVVASLMLKNMDYKGFGPAEMDAQLSVSGPLIDLRGIVVKKGSSRASGSLEVKSGEIKKAGFRFSVWSDDIPARYRIPGGVVARGNILLSGKVVKPIINLKSNLFIKKKQTKRLLEAGSIDMVYKLRDSLNASVNIFGGIYFNVTAAMKDGVQWEANFDIKDSKYEEYIGLLFNNLPEDFTFSLSGKGRLTGKGKEVNGRIRLRRLQLSLYEQSIASHGPVEIDIKNNRLIVKSMQLKAGTSITTVTGEVGLKTGFDLTAYGVFYLSPLQSFLKKISYLTGRADFVIGITGSIDNPVLNGDVTIKNSSLSLTGLPGRIYNLNGYMYLYQNRVVLEELSGNYGDGRIRLKGAAYIKRKEAISLSKLNADITLKEVDLHPFSGLELTVSGNMSISDYDSGYSLVGDMRIIKGLLRKDINWRSLVLKRLKERVKPKIKSASRINMNIAFYGDRDIKIKTNIVEGDAVVDVVVVGSPQKPSLLGRIELKKGKLFFRNNEFNIRHASADFIKPDRIYPYFNVNAETRVRDYNITLILDGYVDEFDLSLVSDPHLDEVDILSLLMLGRLSGELRGMEGGISASEATAFLTGEFQQTIQERIKNLTGFDRIELEPFVSESTGSITPRLTVSKRLLGDRLYLIYSTALGDTTEQLIKIEMKVKDNISLIGERDETGGVGADIRFRVRFK